MLIPIHPFYDLQRTVERFRRLAVLPLQCQGLAQRLERRYGKDMPGNVLCSPRPFFPFGSASGSSQQIGVGGIGTGVVGYVRSLSQLRNQSGDPRETTLPIAGPEFGLTKLETRKPAHSRLRSGGRHDNVELISSIDQRILPIVLPLRRGRERKIYDRKVGTPRETLLERQSLL